MNMLRKAAGYQPGKDIAIALDPAASEFYMAQMAGYGTVISHGSGATETELKNRQRSCKRQPQ